MSRTKHLYDFISRLWPLTRTAFRMSRQPIVGQVIQPFYSTRLHQATIIPVNEAVATGDNVALPYTLLESLAQRASARFLMADCLCRSSHDCQSHPHTLGCLYLGDGAAQINPKMGRLATVDESLAHIQTAMSSGLMPLIVHTVFDAYLLGINYNRMLTICFCCDCCCAVRNGLRLGPSKFRNIVQRLPGVSVEITTDCIECGRCQEVCHVRAITLPSQDHGLGMVSDDCKGCGECVAACPVGAIHLRVDDETQVLSQLMLRIEKRTDIGNDKSTKRV